MESEPRGYLHSKVDVKVLILFILARIDTPLSGQEIFEVAYQDDSLNYFTLAESLPELVESGHLATDERGRYTITDKGRKQGAEGEDSLAVPVVQKVSVSIAEKQIQLRREGFIPAEISQNENGYWVAILNYRDDGMPMMRLEMMAPNEELAGTMAANMKKRANLLYKTNLDLAIESGKAQEVKP